MLPTIRYVNMSEIFAMLGMLGVLLVLCPTKKGLYAWHCRIKDCVNAFSHAYMLQHYGFDVVGTWVPQYGAANKMINFHALYNLLYGE